MHPIRHFITITKHRHLVIKYCFKAGIGFQGLFHDLSKYSPTEFIPGAKYWSGTHSPIREQRREYGYSTAWLHHKGRNKHHYEYWMDSDPVTRELKPVPMPDRYLIEMFCDRIAASKIYKGKDYTPDEPLKFQQWESSFWKIHPETAEKLVTLLTMLSEKGENETFEFIRKNYRV